MKFNINIYWMLVVLLAVVIIAGCANQSPDKSCATRECFVQAANECSPTTYAESQSYGVISFESSNNCSYTEKIVSISNDMPAIKSVLENTSMNCVYTKSSFDADWIKYPVLSAMNCQGNLREVLGSLSTLYASSLLNASAV